MNLLLLAVSPFHAAVLEPDLHLNHDEKSLSVPYHSNSCATCFILEQAVLETTGFVLHVGVRTSFIFI